MRNILKKDKRPLKNSGVLFLDFSCYNYYHQHAVLCFLRWQENGKYTDRITTIVDEDIRALLIANRNKILSVALYITVLQESK